MKFTVTVEVPDSVPNDLRLLAIALLKGDPSASDPLLDCAMENRKGGAKITPEYVEALEDELRELRQMIRTNTDTLLPKSDPDWKRCVLSNDTLTEFNGRYFNLERLARQLGRFGLS